MKSQNRRSQRLALSLVVEISYVMDGRRMKQKATTVNVSAEGALLACERSMIPGHAVQLRIHGPVRPLFSALGTGNREHVNEVVLSLSAHVVRFEENPENNGEYLAAVSFFGSGRVEPEQRNLRINE